MRHAVFGGQRVLPHQEAALFSDAFIRGIWGGLGSGKTTAGALATIQLCAENPWTPAYGSAHPTFLVGGVSRSTIRDSSYKALMEILPSAAIRRERKAEGAIYLTNGVKILMRSLRGVFTGITAFGGWLDEAHLLQSAESWPDFQMRVRDAKARRLGIIVTGIPIEIAWLRTTFGMPEHYADPARFNIHCNTYDNHYLDPDVLEQLASSVGAADVDAYLKGQWHKHVDAVFPEFDAAVHVIALEGDKEQPVHLSLDVGSQSAAVIGQDRPHPRGMGLHIVDEEITDAIDTESTIKRVLARGWKLVKGKSIVTIDPRSHLDVIHAVERAVPQGVQIIRRKQGEPEYDVDYGIRAMRAALRDGNGRVRLTFARSLPLHRRSLLTSMSTLKYKKGSRMISKDNARDHQNDSCRYMVCARLPLPIGSGIEYRKPWG